MRRRNEETKYRSGIQLWTSSCKGSNLKPSSKPPPNARQPRDVLRCEWAQLEIGRTVTAGISNLGHEPQPDVGGDRCFGWQLWAYIAEVSPVCALRMVQCFQNYAIMGLVPPGLGLPAGKLSS